MTLCLQILFRHYKEMSYSSLAPQYVSQCVAHGGFSINIY
jgi:hypothetical protein